MQVMWTTNKSVTTDIAMQKLSPGSYCRSGIKHKLSHTTKGNKFYGTLGPSSGKYDNAITTALIS